MKKFITKPAETKTGAFAVAIGLMPNDITELLDTAGLIRKSAITEIKFFRKHSNAERFITKFISKSENSEVIKI